MPNVFFICLRWGQWHHKNQRGPAAPVGLRAPLRSPLRPPHRRSNPPRAGSGPFFRPAPVGSSYSQASRGEGVGEERKGGGAEREHDPPSWRWPSIEPRHSPVCSQTVSFFAAREPSSGFRVHWGLIEDQERPCAGPRRRPDPPARRRRAVEGMSWATTFNFDIWIDTSFRKFFTKPFERSKCSREYATFCLT